MEVPSGASFSYFVSLDVLKTPFIFTAVSIEQKTEVTQMLTYIYIYIERERERERERDHLKVKIRNKFKQT